jgi:glycosyltransferase involved in cell wall biosynthesis
MKSILYVTENLPATTSGASVATLGLLRALRRGGWGVHLVLILNVRHDQDTSLARALSSRLTLVPRPHLRIPPLAGWLGTVRRLGYAPRWHRAAWRAVDGALRAGGVDLVLLDQIRAAEYGRLAREAGHRVPIALRAHNVEHEINARLASEATGLQVRLEGRIRAHRYREIETHLSRYCDLLLPISEPDGAKLAALNPGFPVAALPSAVDTGHYLPATGMPAGKEMVFVGGMGYGPNLDAVTWFVKEVLPLVIARHPDARFTAVGREPPEWLAGHAPHARGVGFVPDERELVRRGRVFVVPIRYGSGVRTKILNALAMRRPVVSTTVGAEGLDLRSGQDIVLADGPRAFADAVIGVLEDDARAASLAAQGLRAVLARHSPEAVAERLRDATACAGISI